MSDDIQTVDLSDHDTLMRAYAQLNETVSHLSAELAAERERREYAEEDMDIAYKLGAEDMRKERDVALSALKVARKALELFRTTEFQGGAAHQQADAAITHINEVLGDRYAGH